MRKFSAAALIRAIGTAKALFASPCGRHSSVCGRRRRSTRVRRYVPVPAPVEDTAPPAPPMRTDRAPERPRLPAPVPAPRLAPPSERFPADEIALVRPYYEARERELARVRATATTRPHRWTGEDVPPRGDLLAAGPFPAPSPEPLPVPAPRAPSPACEDPEDWRTLTRLTRVWLDQQRRRTQQPTQRSGQRHHRQAVPA
ncbi:MULTISPECIES: hypothetical protein [Nocardiopsis]|uniref:Uncharacterized protein n=1 Tax=Nocardiopsis sinuspersici TaxID=501010 RepID=A0A1V3C605_9ACTN|nr:MULTISPECIES: hypothetical protein [Nocardiopsis]OOC55909.1 hypothetical protein NOSIN_20440 [Nocardiopsis sinuspersici]